MENVILEQSAIDSIIPSSSMQLSTAFLGIESSLLRAAEANVALMGEDFTVAEREAMTTIEELKLINGMDLVAVLLWGKLLQRIEERGMWSYHPARYGSLQEMARDQGFSVSNLSNIRDLNFVFFPGWQAWGCQFPRIGSKSDVIWFNQGLKDYGTHRTSTHGVVINFPIPANLNGCQG